MLVRRSERSFSSHFVRYFVIESRSVSFIWSRSACIAWLQYLSFSCASPSISGLCVGFIVKILRRPHRFKAFEVEGVVLSQVDRRHDPVESFVCKLNWLWFCLFALLISALDIDLNRIDADNA